MGTPIVDCLNSLQHGDCLPLVSASVNDLKAMCLRRMVIVSLPRVCYERYVNGDCRLSVLSGVKNFTSTA
jgi:hypothetical protein